MPRRRKYDPPDLPNEPNLVTDPVRQAEITAEFRRKIWYLKSSYQLEKRLRLDTVSFNASLARLKKGVKAPVPDGARLAQLHPWIEMAINLEARELAGLAPDQPLGDEHGAHIKQAAKNVATRAKAIRGSPGHGQLRRYLEALMVIIQETTGKPVVSLRDKGGIYDPQLPGAMGEAIRMFVNDLEPGVPVSKLAYWVRDARKKYAGKWPDFEELFPGYAGTIDRPGSVLSASKAWPKAQAVIIQPIYCPF